MVHICYCYNSKCVSVILHQTLVIPWFSMNNQTVSKLNADAVSLYNTVKQASGPQVILKTHPPICLDYRAHNRPQLALLGLVDIVAH